MAPCALALVLMAPACDDPPDGPPEFNLVVEEQVLPGSKSSYCIEEGGVGMCALMVHRSPRRGKLTLALGT